jgi:scyllo-inositol 2-dehydrogenase (NADP+)
LPGSYKSYYENIYAAIRGDEHLQVTAEQGRDVIRIIELATKSSKEKKAIEYTH